MLLPLPYFETESQHSDKCLRWLILCLADCLPTRYPSSSPVRFSRGYMNLSGILTKSEILLKTMEHEDGHFSDRLALDEQRAPGCHQPYRVTSGRG